MSKKVYFTSEQLKHIMGEDAMGGYLSNTSTGSEYPVDSIPATDGEVIPTEPCGDTRTADAYAKNKIANNQWTRRGAGYSLYEDSKKKVVKNDEGGIVPDVCPKCGSKVGLYIKGEPVYLCSNEKCNKYFGTKPFKKHLNERNAELDGKKLYSLPNEVRVFATPDGEHDDIMKRLRSGEQMDLPSLYRLRNELGNSSNTKITGAINSLIKRAQMQGDSLRNVHSNTNTGIEQPKSAIPGKGHRKEGNTKIYYENN